MNHVGYIGIETWVRDTAREADRQTVVERESGSEREERETIRMYIHYYIIRISSLLYVSFVTHFVVILYSHSHTRTHIYFNMCVCVCVCVDNKETWVSWQTRPDARLQHRVSLTLGRRSISNLYAYIHNTRAMRFVQTIRRKKKHLLYLPVYIIYVYTLHTQPIYPRRISAGQKYRFHRLLDCTRRVPQQSSYSYHRQIDTCWRFDVPHITYIDKILYKYIYVWALYNAARRYLPFVWIQQMYWFYNNSFCISRIVADTHSDI